MRVPSAHTERDESGAAGAVREREREREKEEGAKGGMRATSARYN